MPQLVIGGQQVRRGDVLVVQGTADVSKLIEIGAVLVGNPAASHVAGFDHFDEHGTPWGMEGRPGGFGWVDLTAYVKDPRTVTNAAQPKTDDQRDTICQWMRKLDGTAYDWWGGIVHDAANAAGIEFPEPFKSILWKPDKSGMVPGHVVCSSSYAWIYLIKAALAAPKAATWEETTPGNWSMFIAERAWQLPPRH